MDTLAHGLWSFGIFHKKRHVWLATLFGILPDLLSFGILIGMSMANGNFQRGRPSLNALPGWLDGAYNLTHSFIMFLAVFILVYIATRKWLWPLTAWAIHILTDIPTHSSIFFPTPFLWPLSDYKFDGISWATGWFMLLNYGGLMAIFLVIAHNKRKEKRLNFRKKGKMKI